MDRKRELKELYKNMKIPMGVYQIRNTQNEKVFIGTSKNLHGKGNSYQTLLELKTHTNKILQEDWNKFGKDAFVFEVLETLEKKEEGFFDVDDELKKLEKKWLEKKAEILYNK